MSGVITRLVQLRGLLLYLFSTLWTGFRGGCLKPLDKTDSDGKHINQNVCQNYSQFKNKQTLDAPFVVESVSAVDGCNISGVIEEVGTNCALCSDRHLLSRRSPCSKSYRHLGILFMAMVLPLPKSLHVYRLPSCWLTK